LFEKVVLLVARRAQFREYYCSAADYDPVSMDFEAEYSRLYVRKPINDETSCELSFELPTLHIILLYCEWFLSEEQINRVNELVRQHSQKRAIGSTINLDSFNDFINDNDFMSSIRSTVGADLYDYACAAVGDGEVAIPLGLAPSYWLFSSGCSRCSSPLYIRSFCLHCGCTTSGGSASVSYESPFKRNKSGNYSKKGSKGVGLNTLKRSSNHLSALDSSADLAVSKRTGGSPAATADLGMNLPTSLAMNQGIMYNPKTNISSVVTTFSLEQLLALSNQPSAKPPIPCKTAPLAGTRLRPNGVALFGDELEVVEVKKEIVVIDLMDSSDGEAIAAVNPWEDRQSGHYGSGTPSASPCEHVTVKEEPEGDLAVVDSVYTLVSQSSGSRHSLPSYSQCHDGASDDGLGVGSEDGSSLQSVKLEWPARRMDKYEMCAMRGNGDAFVSP
jgi:hypothetical protein